MRERGSIRKASSYSCLTSWAVASAAAAALLVQSVPAHAEEVSGSGKGSRRGSAARRRGRDARRSHLGVKPAWAYIIGGIVGAGGGALAGTTSKTAPTRKCSVLHARWRNGALSSRPRWPSCQATCLYAPPRTTPKTSPPGAPVPEPPRRGTPSRSGPSPHSAALARCRSITTGSRPS